MDKQVFEAQYREQVNDILNRLQSAMLISTQLESVLIDIGQSVQVLTRDVEKFLSSSENPHEDSDSVV